MNDYALRCSPRIVMRSSQTAIVMLIGDCVLWLVGWIVSGSCPRDQEERMRVVPAVGVHATATDRSMPVVELAAEVESRGLRSLYLAEHTHVTVGSRDI